MDIGFYYNCSLYYITNNYVTLHNKSLSYKITNQNSYLYSFLLELMIQYRLLKDMYYFKFKDVTM